MDKKISFFHLMERRGKPYALHAILTEESKRQFFANCGHFGISNYILQLCGSRKSLSSSAIACMHCAFVGIAKRLRWCNKCSSVVLTNSMCEKVVDEDVLRVTHREGNCKYDVAHFLTSNNPHMCLHFRQPAISLDI